MSTILSPLPFSPTMTGDSSLIGRLAGVIAASPDPDVFGPTAAGLLAEAIGATRAALCVEDGESVTVRWSVGSTGGEDDAPALVAIPVPGPHGGARWRFDVDPEAAGRVGTEVHAALALLGAVLGPAEVARSLRAEMAAHATAAAAERDFAAAVLDALPFGVYVTDRDHRVQLWNHRREVDTFGVGREAALGRIVFDVLPRQNAALMERELDDVLRTGQLSQFDTESTASGEKRVYRLSKIPMAHGAAEATHVITLGEDVTEWRSALDRSAQSEKLAAVGQLAAGVMHEINNPLGTIAACAETMTLGLAEQPEETRPPGFTEYLRIIDHEVHRCRRIVDGLLNFSRAREPRRARVSLDTVVEQTLGLLRHHARFKRCAVQLDLGDLDAAGRGAVVLGDPDQLTQIAMALLLNAADAIVSAERDDDPDRPRRGITIRTRRDDAGAAATAVLEIADEGTGMSDETQARIFDPFFTTKPQGEGTGLGLAICYGLARDLGGRIDVESAVGVGTTFRVTLPAA